MWQLYSHSDKTSPFLSAQALAFQRRSLASVSPGRHGKVTARRRLSLSDAPALLCRSCQASSTAVQTFTSTSTVAITALHPMTTWLQQQKLCSISIISLFYQHIDSKWNLTMKRLCLGFGRRQTFNSICPANSDNSWKWYDKENQSNSSTAVYMTKNLFISDFL